MNQLTLTDIRTKIENAKESGSELRGKCPLCGSKTGFAATDKDGRLLIYCHACEAPFKDFIKYFGGSEPFQLTPDKRPGRAPERAVQTAERIWSKASPAPPENPYLARKGVKPHGARQDNNRLVIPARNIDGDIYTLQSIFPNGDKRFLRGGKKKGCFFILNDKEIDPAGTVYLAEGFATAASIQEAIGGVAVVAFDAGNLLPVAKAIRQKYPDVELVVCGDDDRFKPTNKGREAATMVALEVNGKVCFPSFKKDDGEPTDFNDLHRAEGLEIVAAQVREAAEPEWPAITLFEEDDDQPQDYPVDALPDAIKTAAEEVSRFCKVAEVGPAMVGVSVIATAIGKKAKVEERSGLEHHPALFFMGIAGPSERKTPTFKAMVKPLDDYARDMVPDYEAKKSKAKANNDLIDAAQARLKRDVGKEGADLDSINEKIIKLEAKRLPLPQPPRMHTTDTTEEKLFQLMHSRGGAYAVLTGEGRSVINAILGRYSDGTGEALYLAGITGDTITRDRVGGKDGPEEKAIYEPCLNVCIFVQPDKNRELAANPTMTSSGLDARIFRAALPVRAGTRMEERNETGLCFSAMEHNNLAVRTLLDTPQGEHPHIARLSPEAAEARRLFHNEIERQLGPSGALSDVADIAGKCCSQTAKLALVFHLAEDPSLLAMNESTISLDTWTRAEILGRYHLQESVRLRRAAVENTEIDKARKIALWLASKGIEKFSKSYLQRRAPRPRLKKDEAENVLNELLEHNVIAKEDSGYIVNPDLQRVAKIATIASATPKNKKQQDREAMAILAILATDKEETPAKLKGAVNSEPF